MDFRGLGPQLRLEFQYAVQARRDEQTVTAPARMIAAAIRWAREEHVGSLLDYSAERWQRVADPYQRRGSGGYDKRVAVFLLYARDAVETLRDGTGWEVEYARDVWRLGKLTGLNRSVSRPRPRSELWFDRITQPWMRVLAKRWIRLRLSSGLNVSTVVSDMQALTRFSEFLDAVGPTVVRGLGDVDRALLERYLAWLTDLPGGLSSNESRVNGLHLFFQAIRQHGWDDSLPTSAAFFTGDCPRRRTRLARHLAEHIMTQVEQPANLDRWTDPAARLITLTSWCVIALETWGSELGVCVSRWCCGRKRGWR
ncbi:hypothetical protein ACFVZH_40140, partial [Streptomyces sp. NPDC059534]